MSGEPRFDEAFLGQLDELLKWRRDVRRFAATALPEGTLGRLLSVASLAPSVGLSEPWRFVTVDDSERRAKVRDSFSKINAQALAGHVGDKAKLYASLKLEGFEAPGHVAVFCDSTTAKGSDLGRTSMPETAEYSVVAAIQLIWMVARAQGLGLGWVSILDPQEVAQALDVPPSWKLIAYLCIGFPAEESLEPELQRAGWEERMKPEDFIVGR
jgi:5,6-dimethylbenzimidazole synthase